jgi:acyl-CoA dehydrogenase
VDLGPSEPGLHYQSRGKEFLQERVYPAEREYHRQVEEAGGRHHHPKIMEQLKDEARSRGLWNLFHPHAELGPGLSNVDYAQLTIARAELREHAPDFGAASATRPASSGQSR